MEIELLIKLLSRQVQLLEQISAKLDTPCPKEPNQKNKFSHFPDLADSTEIKTLLKIGDSTLYRLKKDKSISTIRIGKRDYYNIAEIEKALKKP